MTRPLVCALALVAVVCAVWLASPATAATIDEVSVSTSTERIATQLGGKFTFTSTITNDGQTEASGLIAHLNVLSLRDGTYVDPEDWSSNRTRYLDPIEPGGSQTLTWRMQAVNDGDFGVYVAVLPESGEAIPPATGPTIHLDVAGRKTLSAGGIVPLVLGIPAGLALLAFGIRLGRRRS